MLKEIIMSDFFSQMFSGGTVTHKSATFDLPILYFRDDFFALFFNADEQKVRAALPSDNLHPVSLTGKGAVVGIGAFNYIDTSIGSYGEIGVVVPVVHKIMPLPLWPLLREGKHPGFGLAVLHLPVTKLLARDAGRGQWGYTKFTSHMLFRITPEFQQVEMHENGRHILTMRVLRSGFVMRDKTPFITYSVKDGNLIRTVILQKGAFRQCFFPRGSFLALGDHEVSQSIRALGLSQRPIQSRYSVERSAILPAGEIVETGVRPLEGWFGQEREGSLSVEYR
jgi:hypothetical protein